ncbi:alpha/beta fold hydrolase [Paeniglutamicibacter psychrophenolicus]|uniref:Pimeloyl-ACP methyl ester carboxylesterase n=1 Tax=Paeniglutamicibacter psychrophenolicus TaxID=257454 RepID=A0ABS4WAM8_9MICC|nr:alpha/beta fold hydrolase [Paeniglutamicibacter psychrophenolicus]MBP2373247.1 pimeloyl-ACP methyl ester carboxylesterase [Paeniglutamicibacter psychrophenolicus]
MTNSKQATVVLLHGVGLDHTMWRPLQQQLGRVSVALDLPGHGQQPALREPQDLASLARDVLGRMDESGPVHLVGFSLGALVAQHIARFAPERVLTLTAVNSVCQRTAEESASVEQRLATAGEHFEEGVDKAIERWYPKEQSTVPADIIADTRRVLAANDLESYLHAYAVFARGDREIAGELGSITQPTLAITGELDPGSTPEMSHRLGAAIPHCTVHVVPGARHMLPVENAPALAAQLNSFFSENEGMPS